MFDRFARSWELTKQSMAVLRQDKHLLIFPILSSIACLFILVSFAVPLALSIDWESVRQSSSANSETRFQMQPHYYPLLFLFYFVNYFVIAFFNSALIACAIRRFNGDEAGVAVGLAEAGKRLPQLVAWSLVNSTVGMVLRMISERAGIIGKIVISLVGMVWTIATFFVVPVLVIEGVGPFAAIKRSTQVLRKTWGETLIANVGIGAAMGLIGLLTFLACLVVGGGLALAFDSPWPLVAAGGALVVLITMLSLIASTLKMILIAACYRYASTGLIAEQFDGDGLRSMFRRK